MPTIVDNPIRSSQRSTEPRNDYDYSSFYPEGLDLRPGTKVHDRLREAVLERARESERHMTQYHSKWQKFDKMLTAFMPLDEYESSLQDRDERSPVSIVVPESYATLETLLTYCMLSLSSPPLFKFSPVGPEDVRGAILLERIVEQQVRRMKALLALHTHFRDGFTYGIGPVALKWVVKTGKRALVRESGFYTTLGEFQADGGVERVLEDAILYEGTVLEPIDPYLYLPDPTAPIHEPQKGTFVGWKEQTSFERLLNEESEPGSILFNTRYLKDIQGRSSIYPDDPSARHGGIGATTRRDATGLTRPIDVVWMYWNLIPREWEIGDSDVPEKWIFGVAGDEIVVSAWPTGLMHKMFPVACCAPDSGGHEFMPISRLELMYPLQHVLNWYYNSHVYNVRKALGNNFIVDPKIININDVLKPGAGKIIRTRRVVWGRGVKDGIEQLKVEDMTGNHMNDLMLTRDLSRNITGAVDSLQGLQRSGGERVTKAEFMETRGSAISRLQKAMMLMSLQSLSDIGLMYAYHTQQFMSDETYVQMAGRLQDVLAREYGMPLGEMPEQIGVTPFDISVGFDVEISDASTERGDFADDWLLLMDKINQNQELAMNIDITRVFLHLARLMGKRDAHEFIRKVPLQTMVAPNEQVMGQVQAGNLVPVEEGAQSEPIA